MCWADRWTANTIVMCSDRFPREEAAKLFLGVDWTPDKQDGQVRLNLRMLREGQNPRVIFQDNEDQTSCLLTGDSRRLINLAANSESPGTEPDIALDIVIDDEVQASVPLSVGAVGYQISIQLVAEETEEAQAEQAAEAGEGEEQGEEALPMVVAEQTTRIRAIVEPPTPGTVRWLSVMPDTLEISGSAEGEMIEVIPHARQTDHGNARVLLALFTPETADGEEEGSAPAAPSVMAVQQFNLADQLVYRGRVVDSIGEAIANATVSAFTRGGHSIEDVTTNAEGRFELCMPFYEEFELVLVSMQTRRAIRITAQQAHMLQPQDLGDLILRIAVVLSGTVGHSGANNPVDLRRVQRRLQYLGRLTQADMAAEPINVGAGPVNPATVPRLMTALYNFFTACFGSRLTNLQPGGLALTMLNAHPLFPLSHIRLANPVGDVPGGLAGLAINTPPEVRAVQERLYQLHFLTEAQYFVERVSTTAAGPIDPLTIPQTIIAIRRYQTLVVFGSLKCFAPDLSGIELLNDPYQFGKMSLSLEGSVGTDGENRPADVRAVQERLLELKIMAQTDYNNEQAAIPDPTATPHPEPIAETDLTHTIAAIRRFRETVLGVNAPAEGRVDLVDPTLERLNYPLRIDLSGAVGELLDHALPNRASDVRALQDRLHLLRILSDVGYNNEKINPARYLIANTSTIAQTIAAIRTYRRRLFGENETTESELVIISPDEQPAQINLSAGVGTGQNNHRRDVRPVQDRLFALGFLSQAHYDSEKVEFDAEDPDSAAAEVNIAVLTNTIAAIVEFKEHVLRLPTAAIGEDWTAHGIIEPNDVTHQFLNDPLFFGREEICLQACVGTLGWNHPRDCRAIQDRLREYGIITQAHYEAERVDPEGHEPISETDLTQSIAAIARFRQEFLSATAPAVGRVEAFHPTLARMNNPLFSITSQIDLTGSVGTGGDNLPADVRPVQDRLRDLGFLEQTHFRTEAVDAAGGAAVPDANIPQTLTAINTWGSVIMRAHAAAQIETVSITLRKLNNPVLPLQENINITSSVGGRGGVINQEANVRVVQDRLHDLGILSTVDYLQERAAAGGVANVNQAAMAQTIQAIHQFQCTASGGTDDTVDADGHTERVLQDPTFSTPTMTNPHTNYRNAGPAMPAFIHAVQQIILAIEAHEAGGSNGEVPAVLRNGSQTPASFGKAQMIGSTGFDTMDNNPAYANFYDLGAVERGVLQTIINNTLARYNAIYNTEVPAAVTEVQLNADIQAYIAANLNNFHADTGLGEFDIVNMFRTAQLRRQMRDHINAQPVPPGTPPGDVDAVQRAAAVVNIMVFLADADVAVNVAALNMRQGDVRAFLRRAIDAEHRAGFITRALFYSRYGQIFRNALTDDSGFKLGRFLIRDNYNRVTAAEAAAGAALTAQQRARITARIHNSGPGGLAGYVAAPATAVNNYVNNVMAHWVP
ncbi:MAG: carboxypeptidase regulatory-like domain-containing protein [Desulfobacterales bacterium]|nr:carboxypeptidase regulatory-like domain-containing protein [Desulfobacterales bacterium]